MESSEHNAAADAATTATGANLGTVRLRTPDRSQATMTVQCPDDLIPKDHQARVIWQVVASMDLSAFLAPIKARDGACGRDATDPRLLVALWLYATTRGVGSARELARLCDPDEAGARPYLWLCGGVTVNHHTLSDFRVGHAAALDELFTQTLAVLVKKGIVKVKRISQDGTRVRGAAGASSFRRAARLDELLAAAKQHVEELRALLDDPAKSAALSAKQKAARQRAARERQARVEQAIEALPKLQEKQAKRARKVAKKDKAKKLKEPRASTTDPEAHVMKMPDGGYRPAVNVQLAVDTESRAVVGVDVVGAGTDHGLTEPMRQQVQERTGLAVEEHLTDGGYLVMDEVERAAAAGVTVYVPPKPPRNKELRGSEYEPRPGESQAIKDWRARMGSEAGQAVYKERASTVETVNADLKRHRGLGQMAVRGLKKAKCVALWCAMAYNPSQAQGRL